MANFQTSSDPAAKDSPRITLVGNPNVGKSVIFGYLTGKYVAVSNYPGTTVEVSRGSMRYGGRTIEVIDTPGVNSLVPQSAKAAGISYEDLCLRLLAGATLDSRPAAQP